MPIDPAELARVTTPIAALSGKLPGGPLRAGDWNALVDAMLGLAALVGSVDVEGPGAPPDLTALTARVAALEALPARLDGVEARLTALEGIVGTLSSTLAPLPDAVAGLRADVDGLGTRVTALEEAQKSAAEAHAGLAGRVDAAATTDALDTLSKRVDRAHTRLRDALDTVDTRDAKAIAALEDWRAGVDERLAGLSGDTTGTIDLSGVRAEVLATLDRRLSPLEPLPGLVEALTKADAEGDARLSKRVSGLENRAADIDSATNRVTSLEEGQRLLVERVRGAEASLKTVVDTRIPATEANLVSLRDVLGALPTRIDAIESSVKASQEVVSSSIAEVSSVTSRLRSELDVLTASSQESASTLTTIRGELKRQSSLVAEASKLASAASESTLALVDRTRTLEVGLEKVASRLG